MSFFRKQKGAVSIFLVIILVPMLTISSVFVDVSKVALSRSVINSAGDLALNTALTNYDTVLKDMYGLFATAQDTEELYTKLEDYYRSCIISSGVSSDTADTYAEQLMAQLGVVSENSDVDDMLNMELVDFSASKYSAASLANATVLKKQIIEFQKYRAPINTGLGFLTSLQSFLTIEKQTELVEKRTEYYKAEQTVMENAQLAWQAIRRYEKSGILESNFFTDVGNAFGYNSGEKAYNYQLQYQYFAEKIMMDLYDTENYIDLNTFNAKTYEIKKETVTYNDEDISVYMFYTNTGYTSKLTPYTEYTTYSKDNPAADTDVKSKLTSFNTAYNNYAIAMQKVNSLPGYDDSSTYKTQYLAQVLRSGYYDAYITAAEKLYEAYCDLEHAVYYAGEKNVDGKETKVLDIKEKLFDSATEKTYREYYKDFVSKFTGIYETFNSTLSSLNSNLKTCENQCKTTVINVRSAVKQSITDVWTEICEYRSKLVTAKDELGTAITYLEYVFDGMKDGGTLDTAKANWNEIATDSELANTATAKQDMAEIKNLSDQFDVAEVTSLISRLTNIKTNIENVISQIDSYTFYDSDFISIDSYATLENLIKQSYGDDNLKHMSTNKDALQSAVTNEYEGKFVVGSRVDVSWINDSGTQVDLNGAYKLNFYTYLYTHFKDSYENLAGSTETKTQDQKDAEELYDKINGIDPSKQDDSGGDIDEGSKTAANDISTLDQSKLPSGGSGASTEEDAPGIKKGENAAGDTSDSLGGLFGGSFATAVKNAAEDLRDNLYVSDYIMGMFSYDTIEAEYKTEHPDEATVTLLSLTKENISTTNNYMYGGEVEYILYGGKDSTNKMISYGTIYGIRLAFNMIYAFTDAEIRDGAFAMAVPISAATLGIIPVPLIQAAIIVAISCCESAIDIGTLKSGGEVPLFKNQQSWTLDFESLVKVAKGTATKVAKKVVTEVIDYGTEKISDFLDMSAEELAEALKDKDNMEKFESCFKDSCKNLVERHAGTAIQKFTTLAQNAVDEVKLKGGDAAQIVRTGLDEWIQGEAQGVDVDTDLVYQAKKMAVDVIKENYIDTLVTELQKTYVPDSDEIISNALDDIFSEIRTNVLDKVSNKISTYVTDASTQLKSAMNDSADKLKETLNAQLDKFSGGSTGNGIGSSDNTGISSLLSFSYGDYLRLFLVIGLYTNEKDVLLRTADVIQVNMQKVTGKSSYALSEAAAYVKITATVQVKPTFLPLPLFADVENNPVSNTAWYTIKYSEIKGY